MFGLFRLLGFAALWEFFKSREAGKRIGRAAVGVGAAAAALAALIAVSRVVTTLDDIESQTIRIVYGVLVAVILGALFAFLYVYLRQSPSSPKKPEPLRPPSPARLEALYKKHGIIPGTTSTTRKLLASKSAGSVAIAGMADSGATMVAAALGQNDARVGLELPPLSVWPRDNEDAAEMAAGFKRTVFVADQDLRKYEVEFINTVLAYGRDVIVAVDKSDRLTTSDREEIAASIAAKFDGAKRRPQLVFIASAPLPVNAVIVSADGTEREETRTRKADVAALLAKLEG